MSVLQPDTDFGNHEAFVPDGQIASGASGGGMDFSCLDALTAAWPTTTVNPGNIDVLWENKAPHKTQYYKVYITPLNWDPTQPLKWGDLIEIGQTGKSEAEPFSTVPSVIPAAYAGKRAALVSVWQRDYTESHEAFYSVSDIFVEDDGTGCTTGDPTNVTFANNTNCTLEYYFDNTVQGSANAGSSITVSTTVGSQWEIKDEAGNPVDSLTVNCDLTTYTSSGQCPGNSCSDGDSVVITFTNNTDCTVEYHQHNTLQGSAPAGGTFTVNTVIGSHWDVLDPSGNQVSHFHIMCGQTSFTSTGTCNTGGCDSETWAADVIYTEGNIVELNGVEYKAKWWNTGQNPEQNSGPYDVWEDLGACAGGGCSKGDAVMVMFNNNTNCTLEYYYDNTLQGSAVAGASFMANTTIASHWEARDATGEQVSSFHIMCGQTDYNSTGACNTGGGCATGDVVSITFTNNTDCTVEYYQNNTLQGSANAGASFATEAIVGTQWEARQVSGEQVSTFTIACDQANYNTNGSCNTNGDACATAYGPYPLIYMAGDIVSHNGRNYECLVSNLYNVTPGTAAHWWKDLGPCSMNARMGNHTATVLGDFNFVAFPNPAKDVINIEISNTQSSSYTITIKGIDGKTLETIMLGTTKGSAMINTSIKLDKLSSGIYFVNVTSGQQTLTQKFIVE